VLALEFATQVEKSNWATSFKKAAESFVRSSPETQKTQVRKNSLGRRILGTLTSQSLGTVRRGTARRAVFSQASFLSPQEEANVKALEKDPAPVRTRLASLSAVLAPPVPSTSSETSGLPNLSNQVKRRITVVKNKLEGCSPEEQVDILLGLLEQEFLLNSSLSNRLETLQQTPAERAAKGPGLTVRKSPTVIRRMRGSAITHKPTPTLSVPESPPVNLGYTLTEPDPKMKPRFEEPEVITLRNRSESDPAREFLKNRATTTPVSKYSSFQPITDPVPEPKPEPEPEREPEPEPEPVVLRPEPQPQVELVPIPEELRPTSDPEQEPDSQQESEPIIQPEPIETSLPEPVSSMPAENGVFEEKEESVEEEGISIREQSARMIRRGKRKSVHQVKQLFEPRASNSIRASITFSELKRENELLQEERSELRGALLQVKELIEQEESAKAAQMLQQQQHLLSMVTKDLVAQRAQVFEDLHRRSRSSLDGRSSISSQGSNEGEGSRISLESMQVRI